MKLSIISIAAIVYVASALAIPIASNNVARVPDAEVQNDKRAYEDSETAPKELLGGGGCPQCNPQHY